MNTKLKNAILKANSIIPIQIFSSIIPEKGIFPFYHIVSNENVPHVIHLYNYRNVKEFNKDLDYLCKYYEPKDIREIINKLEQKENISEKYIIFSFDDGYREIYEIIAPILKSKGIPAIFFINNGFVDNKMMNYKNKASLLVNELAVKKSKSTNMHIINILKSKNIITSDCRQGILAIGYQQKEILDDIARELEVDFNNYLKCKKPYLDTNQINKLKHDGFLIGAHSIDHPLYNKITLEEQLYQTIESINYIKENFKESMKLFAFPHNMEGIEEKFFEKIYSEGIMKIAFGSKGIGIQWNKNPMIIQRFSMEGSSHSAAYLLKMRFLTRLIYSL